MSEEDILSKISMSSSMQSMQSMQSIGKPVNTNRFSQVISRSQAVEGSNESAPQKDVMEIITNLADDGKSSKYLAGHIS